MRSKLKSALLVAALCAGHVAAHGQTATQTASFVNDDMTICDAKTVTIPINISLIESSNFTLQYSIDGGATYELPDVPFTAIKNGVYEIELNFGLKEGQSHFAHSVKLISIVTQKYGSINLDDVFMVYDYATPKPEILTDNKLCGYTAELLADNKWSDISTYQWTVSQGTLTDADNYLATLTTPEPATINVTLTETTGGQCTSQTSKQITLQGSPAATIAHLDAEGNNKQVAICSNLDDASQFHFDATLNIDGVAPFNVRLTNGHTMADVQAGTSTFELTANTAQTIAIESVVDANGCPMPNPADDGQQITVVDRKPMPIVTQDTAYYESGRDIALSVVPTTDYNTLQWQLAAQNADYDANISFANSADAQLTTNMNGLMAIDIIETNTDGTTCADTATVYVNIAMPLRYPNGFSPNGDGVNDNLVIEGLPAENMILVCDQKGKKVFQCNNYRNNWQAEGVDDGYYVYIFKGTGTKTVKETLVIKRSK